MSLARLLSGNGTISERFIDCITEITPKPYAFRNLEGGIGFTHYSLLVEPIVVDKILKPYVQSTFTMLLRIVLSKRLGIPFNATELIGDNPHLYFHDPMFELRFNKYTNIVKQYQTKKVPAADLIEFSFILACIHDIRTTGHLPRNINLVSNPTPSSLISEVSSLFEAFHNTFLSIVPITQSSNAILFPQFLNTILSTFKNINLDFFIDGSLFVLDMGTQNSFDTELSRTIASLYVLQLCEKLVFKMNPSFTSNMKNEIDFRDATVKRVCVYKARLGCIEVVDVEQIHPPLLKESMTRMMRMLNYRVSDQDFTDFSF